MTMFMSTRLGGSLIAGAMLAMTAIGPAAAKDPLFSDRWSFKVRGNPHALARAALLRQIKLNQGNNSGTGSGGGAGSSGVMTPNVAANYSIVTAIMGEGAVGQILVDTNQDSIGDQTARTTSAFSIGGNATTEVVE
jgi:hypothetical protein